MCSRASWRPAALKAASKPPLTGAGEAPLLQGGHRRPRLPLRGPWGPRSSSGCLFAWPSGAGAALCPLPQGPITLLSKASPVPGLVVRCGPALGSSVSGPAGGGEPGKAGALLSQTRTSAPAAGVAHCCRDTAHSVDKQARLCDAQLCRTPAHCSLVLFQIQPGRRPEVRGHRKRNGNPLTSATSSSPSSSLEQLP